MGMIKKIGFIGFGEAAEGIAAGLREVQPELQIIAWDILFPIPDRGPAMKARASEKGIQTADGPADIFPDTDIVLSAVTTDQSLVAVQQCALHITPGTLYVDLNSTSPGKKRAIEEVVDKAGGHMIEAAVMDYVPRHGHRVPMVLAGEKASLAAQMLSEIDMQVTAMEGGVGEASTIKMVRSVFMKGLSSVLAECMLAADRAGIQDVVLASIDKSYPGLDWKQLTARALTSTALHAGRRAGEMLESAETLKELGIDPIMASASAERLKSLADLGLKDIAENSGSDTVEGFVENVKAAEIKTAATVN